MATLIDTPAPTTGTVITTPGWTANDVYEISGVTPDPLVGARPGAPFSGLGILNKQAQQLADRTSWLHNVLLEYADRFDCFNVTTGDAGGKESFVLTIPMSFAANAGPGTFLYVFGGYATKTINSGSDRFVDVVFPFGGFPTSLFTVLAQIIRPSTLNPPQHQVDVRSNVSTRLQTKFQVNFESTTTFPFTLQFTWLAIGM